MPHGSNRTLKTSSCLFQIMKSKKHGDVFLPKTKAAVFDFANRCLYWNRLSKTDFFHSLLTQIFLGQFAIRRITILDMLLRNTHPHKLKEIPVFEVLVAILFVKTIRPH